MNIIRHARRGPSAPLAKAGLGLALAVSTLAVTMTGAIFTDTENVGGNTFSTGDVEISPSVTTDLVSFTTPAMVPGDSVVDGVTVTNAGSVEMRYAVTSTTTEDVLAAQLDLVVWDEAVEADSGGANSTCDSTPPETTLYAAGDLGSPGPSQGPLRDVADLAVLPGTASRTVSGRRPGRRRSVTLTRRAR